jgi:hypothetical protein
MEAILSNCGPPSLIRTYVSVFLKELDESASQSWRNFSRTNVAIKTIKAKQKTVFSVFLRRKIKTEV